MTTALPEYAAFGDPDLTPNPIDLLPDYDGVTTDGDGNISYIGNETLLSSNPRLPAGGTVTFTGSITAGETAYVKFENPLLPLGAVEVATLCIAGDTLALVAYRLIDLINKNIFLNHFGVKASYSVVSTNPVINLQWPGPIGNFTVIAALSNAFSAAIVVAGTPVAGDLLSVAFASGAMPAGCAMLKVVGPVTAGDIVSLSFINNSFNNNGVASVSYTVAGGNTLAIIATALAAAINANASLTALGMSANATGNAVYIFWNSIYQEINIYATSSRPGTETITLLGQSGVPDSALAELPQLSELVTIGGTATVGDVLSLEITAGGIYNSTGPVLIQYVVQVGDDLNDIAAGLAANIVSAPALMGVFAVSIADPGVPQIRLVWREIGNVAFSQSVVGVPTEYGVMVNSPDNVPVSYTVAGGNTVTNIATALAAAINANIILQAAGMVASSSSGTVTVKYNGGLNILTITKAINGVETATFGGSIAAGDKVTTTISDASLPGGAVAFIQTVASGDTTTTLATALKNAINANNLLANAGITATSSGAVVSVTSLSQSQTTYARTLSSGAVLTLALANTATETIAITQTVPTQTVTVGGTATVGDSVNLSVSDPVIDSNPAVVDYVVVTGDDLTAIAAGLAAAINESLQLVDAGISATSNAAVVSILNRESNQLPALTAWANGAAETVTLTGTPTVGDVVNILFTNALLATGAQNLQYAVAAGDTTLTLLAASIASAINAAVALDPAGIVATSNAGVISIHWAQGAGAMTFAANVNGTETVTIAGTPASGNVIDIVVTDASVVGSPLTVHYVLTGGDTTAAITAASLAAAIQGTAALTSKGITASASGAVVSIKSLSKSATTYARNVTGGGVTATLGGGPGESVAVAGGPTETLSVSNPSNGSEILTATSPLAGGDGPVIPQKSFTYSQSDSDGGPMASIANYRAGQPILVDWPTVDGMIKNRLPII